MFKWIGCILIMLASGGIGFSKSKELQKHLDELEELKKLFYLIKSELTYTKAPFEEIFDKIVKKVNVPYKEWLTKLGEKLCRKESGSFWEIWCNSIDENLQKCELKEDELEALKNVGKNLEYIENIELYLEQLEYNTQHTREEYRSKQKLCQSMGIMGGIFLVILLL